LHSDTTHSTSVDYPGTLNCLVADFKNQQVLIDWEYMNDNEMSGIWITSEHYIGF
jgi:hypothetical protein